MLTCWSRRGYTVPLEHLRELCHNTDLAFCALKQVAISLAALSERWLQSSICGWTSWATMSRKARAQTAAFERYILHWNRSPWPCSQPKLEARSERECGYSWSISEKPGLKAAISGEAHEGSLRHHHGVETTKTSFPPPPSLFPLRGVLGTRGCLTITFIRSWGILQMLNITDEHYRMLVMWVLMNAGWNGVVLSSS